MKFCSFVLLTFLACSNAAVRNNYFGTNARTQTKYSGSSSGSNANDVKILRNDQVMRNDGSYRYEYETSNGISGMAQGTGGGASVQGSSSYISPEGVEIKLTYTADETGYHPVGDHIPKTPDYILRALEYIRTHPYKKRDDSGGSLKKSPLNSKIHKISTSLAPPIYKPASARRVAPPSSKYSSKPSPRNQYKSKGSSKYNRF